MPGSARIVSDVMTRTVVAVGGQATFKEIVRTMGKWKVSALPVLDGEGRVVGVVSEADLLRKEEYRATGPALPRTPSGGNPVSRSHRLGDVAKAAGVSAQELMTSPPVCVHAHATLAQAARTMAERHVKRLPVRNAEGRLCGIVSRSDLLKVFLREDDDIAEDVRHGVVAYLFPGEPPLVQVGVRDGVVTLTGTLHDTSLVPVAARLARAVEGVVDVEFHLTGATAGAPVRKAGARP